MSAPVHDCVGALLVRDGRILLGRRSEDCDWLAGAWDVFGGHVEPGESGPQALHRELQEELGIVPVTLRYLGRIGRATPEPWRLRLYVVPRWRGTPENRQEHAELRWCGLDEASGYLGGAHEDFPRLFGRAMELALHM